MNRFEDIITPNFAKTPISILDNMLILSNNDSDNQTVSQAINSISNHPNIKLNQGMFQTSTNKSLSEMKSSYHLFLNEPSILEVYSWYQNNMFDVLKQVSVKYQHKCIGKVAQVLLVSNGFLQKFNIEWLFGFGKNFKFSTQFAVYSQTKNWPSSPVRCLTWHPYLTKLAIATVDDSVRILSTSNCLQGPILRRPEQKNITCLAWRPFTDTDLAVACENGIIIWSIAAKSLMVSNSTVTNQKILKYGKENCISCIDWNPNGDLLISTSLKNRSIVIWNADLEQYTVLYSLRAGNTLVTWAPNNLRLLTVNCNLVFRIWDCYKWKSDHWNIASGHVQTAVWSPCGTILLFASSTDPLIYSLNFDSAISVFQTVKERSLKNAQPIFDTTLLDVGNNLAIGGRILCMKWNPQANYIALIFQDSNFVAILKTRLKPFAVLSNFIIWGKENEYASIIDFQNNFINGSCLTIAWSSGRLQHFVIEAVPK